MILTRSLPRRAILAVLAWGGRLLAGLTIALAVSSYFAYTTAGFDFERETPAGGFEVAYYRLRWADGATWVGRAVQPVGRPNHAPDWFDPGGTLLAAPSSPEPPRWCNRWGFWWIARATDDPYVAPRYPGATTSRWVAIPSWLVIAGVAGRSICRCIRRVSRSPSPP